MTIKQTPEALHDWAIGLRMRSTIRIPSLILYIIYRRALHIAKSSVEQLNGR
jgi:hypothetical protein